MKDIGFQLELLTEGKASFYAPRESESDVYIPSTKTVFYNPVMRLNRDISVLALRSFRQAGNRASLVADPLAGCGVRGVRFALEAPFIDRVEMNDLNPLAVELQRRNVALNSLSEIVGVNRSDANVFLSAHSGPGRRFDFVDLDPFGSPVRFLDSAIRSLRGGGLLALTATDMAALCGVHSAACRRKYFSTALRTEYCHELAVRIVLNTLVVAAAKYEFGVLPVFSHSSDHYIRLYVLLILNLRKADECLRELGYLVHCFSCFHRESHRGFSPSVPDVCPMCGGRVGLSGPIWLGRIFDQSFIKQMQRQLLILDGLDPRLPRLLELTILEHDAPITYYVIDRLTDRLNIPIPKTVEIFDALSELGYRVVPTHFHPKGLRTDASSKVLSEVVLGLSAKKSVGK
ncbi:MAG: tRNA (guanine(10)-N(2))-dimethyltransferase [Candidatus Bathyarchaeota archaeon]|nr:MAG: tRNA (guanine(10)-N(2))-dimethyltransferase [Candidatus Bathyarchaeota archaeon]